MKTYQISADYIREFDSEKMTCTYRCGGMGNKKEKIFSIPSESEMKTGGYGFAKSYAEAKNIFAKR